jgi:hypothetical protein
MVVVAGAARVRGAGAGAGRGWVGGPASCVGVVPRVGAAWVRRGGLPARPAGGQVVIVGLSIRWSGGRADRWVLAFPLWRIAL